MSTTYKHGDRIPSEVLCSRLNELAEAVTKGPDTVRREFTMRVPAELDRDADLVMSASARRMAELEAALSQHQMAATSTTNTIKTMSNIINDMVVANQAAWIEWRHGKGAEAAMSWIEGGLFGPGHIPDEGAPYGKEAQAWYDANKSDPFPTCPCGRPSNILWMGQGFCCDGHYQQALSAAKEDV